MRTAPPNRLESFGIPVPCATGQGGELRGVRGWLDIGGVLGGVPLIDCHSLGQGHFFADDPQFDASTAARASVMAWAIPSDAEPSAIQLAENPGLLSSDRASTGHRP